VTFDDCTGMAEPAGTASLSVYPNPSAGSFIADIHGFNEGSWELMTAAGILLDKGNIPSPAVQINLNIPDHAAGIYLLKVSSDGKSLVRKVVVTP